LTAINAGDTEPDDFGSSDLQAFGRTSRRDSRKIKIYDFKRPDVVSKDDFHSIQHYAETFTKKAAKRDNVHIHIASIDQLTFEEFIRSIPTPTTIISFRFKKEGLPDSYGVIEIDPVITKGFVCDLFSSDPEVVLDKTKRDRPTDIEARLASVWGESLIRNYVESFRDPGLTYEIVEATRNPSTLLRYIDAGDMSVLTSFEAKVYDEGMINVNVDARWIRNYIRSMKRPVETKETIGDPDCDLSVSVKFHPIDVTLGEIEKMHAGFMLSSQDKNLEVFVEDSRLFAAKLVEGGVKIKVEIKWRLGDAKMKDTNIVHDLGEMKIPVSVELGRTSKSLRDIRKFAEGTIFELDKMAGEPVDIFAGNVLIAKGEVIVINETMGVRICDIEDGLPE
jgi:flagellar motor switch protein FliM